MQSVMQATTIPNNMTRNGTSFATNQPSTSTFVPRSVSDEEISDVTSATERLEIKDNIQEHKSSFRRYKQLPGANDKGPQYEYLLSTYYALKLCSDKNVVNFEITTSNKSYGVFDDITLKIYYTDGSVKFYLLQLKHKDKERRLERTDLDHSDNYGLFKYMEWYKTNKEKAEKNGVDGNKIDLKCVIFTNKPCNGKSFKDKFEIVVHKIEKKRKQEKDKDAEGNLQGGTATDESEEHLLNQDDQKSYSVTVDPEEVRSCNLNIVATSTNQKTKTLFRCSLTGEKNNVFLLTDQVNVDTLKSLVFDTLPILDNYTKDLFVSYMASWRNKNFVFTKDDCIAKLAELSFRSCIHTLPSEYHNNDFARHLNATIMDHQITIVTGVNNIPNIFYRQDEATLSQIGEGKNEYAYARTAKDKYMLDNKSVDILLWYLDKIPLFVKVTEDDVIKVKSIAKFLIANNLKKRVFFYGEIRKEDILDENCSETLRIFGTLHDLEYAHFMYLTSSLVVRLDGGRETISPRELDADEEIKESITLKELFKGAVEDGGISVAISEYNDDITDNRVQRIALKQGHQIPEKQITNSFVNVLYGPAGIGKSDLFMFLSREWCLPKYYSIYVNLRLQNDYLEKESDVEKILRHFLEPNETNVTPFVRKIKEFLSKKEIHFFLDGLDEIEPHCRRIIYNLIKEIIKKGHKVWINSRYELQNEITENLSAESVTNLEIQELNEREQKEYFRKRLNGFNDVNNIIDVIYESLRVTNCVDLLGNPWQLNVLVEYFLDPKRKDKNINKLNRKGFLLLSDIMKEIIDRATNRFLEKASVENSQFFSNFIKSCQRQYQVLALRSCLGDTAMEKLNVGRQYLSDFDNIFGIIKKFENNFPVFIHEKYHEYFSSIWLSNNIERVKNLEEEIFQAQYQGLKQTLDIILADDLNGQCALHLAVIYNKISQFNDKNLDTICKEQDKGGRTPVHILFSHGISNDELTKSEETIKELLKEKTCFALCDSLFQFNCTKYLQKCVYLPFKEYITNNYNIV